MPVVEVTFGSESVSCGGTSAVVELTSDRAESGLGEQVVELASPFSTLVWSRCGCVEGAMVQVDTVLVDVVVNTIGRTEEAVNPVDLRVGVTVAEGFVNAAGLLSLSTRGLMGMVPDVAGVPTLLGSGKGREDESSRALGD